MNNQVTGVITSKDSDVQVTIISSSPAADNRKEVIGLAVLKLAYLLSQDMNASNKKALAHLVTDASLEKVRNRESDYWVSDDGEYTLTIIEK